MDMVVTDMIADGSLSPIAPELQPKVGLTIAHWWAPDLAAAWVAHARTLLRQVDTVDASMGVFYMNGVFGSIASAYNALNVPWYMHAPARNIYRKYMAGPPFDRGEDSFGSRAKFRSDINYSQYSQDNPGDFSDGWYRPNAAYRSGTGVHAQKYPMGTSFKGLIPDFGRRLFVAYYPRGPIAAQAHPNAFVQLIQLDLTTGTGSTPSPVLRVGYQASVMNALYPMSFVDRELESMGSCRMYGDGGGLANGANCKVLPLILRMQSFFYDTAGEAAGNDIYGAEALRMAAPMVAYKGWADEWLTALEGEAPERVVVGVRYYTAYVNTQQSNMNPTFRNAIEAADRTEFVQEHTADAGIRMVSTTIAGVGAVVALVPGVGPIIGGALAIVAAGIEIFNQAMDHDTHDLYKDDLGRTKPSLERAWLSGDPRFDAPDRGLPQISVPLPPDMTTVPARPSRPGGPVIGGINPTAVQNYVDTHNVALATPIPVVDPALGDRESSGRRVAPDDGPSLLERPATGLAIGAAVGLALAKILF
jgi:hypothetical protein